jgi:hydroxylamine dehydrogenase
MRPPFRLRPNLTLILLSFALTLIVLSITHRTAIIRAQEARSSGAPAERTAWGAKEGELCLGCHGALNPALTQEWRIGAHGQKGVNCFDCHRAEPGDLDSFNHNGALISVIVSPKDCSRCHQKEVDEQRGSHHAKAGQILASLDNFNRAQNSGYG